MKDTLTSRVGRILSGSVNALIDSIENAAPEIVMEEAIREIDQAVDDVRAELGIVVANRHLANKRLMDENKKHEDLKEKISFAISEKRDDLAEAAVSQQMDIEAQIPVLESTIADAGEKEKELESYIEALKAKKREMREELRNFIESRKESEKFAKTGSVGPDISKSSVIDRAEKAQVAFDRILEKSAGLPGPAGAADMNTAAKLAELDDLSRANRIKERLAKLKTDSN